jgi:hypothetical protein
MVREGFWQEGKRISWKDEQADGQTDGKGANLGLQ